MKKHKAASHQVMVLLHIDLFAVVAIVDTSSYFLSLPFDLGQRNKKNCLETVLDD